MNTYEFQGTFTFICDAENAEEARIQFEEAMDSILYDYRVDNFYGEEN